MADEQFTLKSDLHSTFAEDFERFFKRYYIYPMSADLKHYSGKILNGQLQISYIIYNVNINAEINVNITGLDPITITVRSSNPAVLKSVRDKVSNDIEYLLTVFNENIRRTSFYMTFIGEAETSHIHAISRRTRTVGNIFRDSMIGFYMIFFIASFAVIFILGNYLGIFAPLLLITIQLIPLLFAHKIMLRSAEIEMTPEYPHIILLSYQVTKDEFKHLMEMGKDVLTEMKNRIFENTIKQGLEISCQSARDVFRSFGVACNPENLSVKKIDIKKLFEDLCIGIGLPCPRVGIINSYISNAAATGISPKYSSVIITTGILEQLDEEEIKTVLAHELSHVKRHDPLAFFGLFTGEYLFRVYVLFFLFPSLGMLFAYFLVVFPILFFVAKFFETRADTDAVILTGKPEVFASALRKIGFKRLYFERIPSYRINEWLNWDPHPPVYFRIDRIKKLPHVIKHPFLLSAKQCIQGFINALKSA